MAIFKALTFDGVNSLDYGIYITGEAVYNAPERAVEMVNIPGKNGALALDQGRFENIEVTYHAGCFADNQADFADKVMKFRNALASRYTYKRLTDEYHPDEYRLGLYKNGLDVDAVRYGTAGEFNIVFDCKPQRFLVDGDREILPTEWSDVQTESGELVTIDSDGSLAVRSLEVELEPIQDLHGYDHPWPAGGGKNLLPMTLASLKAVNTVVTWSGNTYTRSGITFTVLTDANDNVTGIRANGTATAEATFYQINNTKLPLASGQYIFNGCPSGGGDTTYRMQIRNAQTWMGESGSGRTFTYDASTTDTDLVRIDILNGAVCNNVVFKPMIRLASDTDATFEPYTNVCPISGRTEVVTIVSPTTSASDGQTYTTALGRTVYGGTLDVVSGVLTVDRALLSAKWSAFTAKTTLGEYIRGRYDFSNIAWTKNMQAISNVSPVRPSGWNTDTLQLYIDTSITASTRVWAYLPANTDGDTDVQVCIYLATPQTYQLTPQRIDLLLGTNHLWSDGEITVEYGVHPYYNPTPFESKPLIKVTGTGTLGIGEYILTITGTASQTLYIDCETMEIYTLEGTVPTGASSLVSINKNDFPVLEPGTNNISVGSGIKAVTITPRWWRI